MSDEELLIYGASGHAKVIIDIIERAGRYRIVGLLDDDPQLQSEKFFGYPVLGGGERLAEESYPDHRLVIAVGDNFARREIWRRVEALRNFQYALAVHPAAQIGREVQLGEGTVVMANVAINPGTLIGRQVIINTGATVDHDCLIGDFAHISPGVHLAGNVQVGELTHLGVGTAVLPGVHIGARSLIGAGAVVIGDIPDGVIAVGVPARVIKQRSQIGPGGADDPSDHSG